MIYDVIVLGGGVAGLVTALALLRCGLRVLVFERSDVARRRVGEHLAPDARPWLTMLGLWDAFCADGHVRSPGVRAAWGAANLHDREYILNPYGDGWNLDRTRFDAMLYNAVTGAGGHIFDHAKICTISEAAGVWSVAVDTATARASFRGLFLVDATGRQAMVARKVGGQHDVQDHLIALMGWMQADANLESANLEDATLLIEAAPTGWWYATLLPNQQLVVAFMTDPPLPARDEASLTRWWWRQFADTHFIRPRAAGFVLSGEICAHAATTCRSNALAGARWLAVGDAATAFDPLSSMGMSKAFRSGLGAAMAILRTLQGDHDALAHYARNRVAEYEHYLVQRRAIYCQETRWQAQRFWSSRQQLLSP